PVSRPFCRKASESRSMASAVVRHCGGGLASSVLCMLATWSPASWRLVAHCARSSRQPARPLRLATTAAPLWSTLDTYAPYSWWSFWTAAVSGDGADDGVGAGVGLAATGAGAWR